MAGPEQIEAYGDFSASVLREGADVLVHIFAAYERARGNVVSIEMGNKWATKRA